MNYPPGSSPVLVEGAMQQGHCIIFLMTWELSWFVLKRRVLAWIPVTAQPLPGSGGRGCSMAAKAWLCKQKMARSWNRTAFPQGLIIRGSDPCMRIYSKVAAQNS